MEDLELVARRCFEAIDGHDFDALAGMYTADAEYVRSDGSSTGPDAIVAYIKTVLDAFPDHTSTLDVVLVSPSAATVEWTEAGTHTQPYETAGLGTIPPTGKAFKTRIVDIFRFQGNLIAAQHQYYDRMAIAGQLGWLAAMAAARPAAPSSTSRS